jgi:hypothetical protein
MCKHLRNCPLAITGIVLCWSLPALAQPPPLDNAGCPAGYWLMDPFCVHKTIGDVVNAAPSAAATMTDHQGCAPGYWRLEQVCVSKAMDEGEMVEEHQQPKLETSTSRR